MWINIQYPGRARHLNVWGRCGGWSIVGAVVVVVAFALLHDGNCVAIFADTPHLVHYDGHFSKQDTFTNDDDDNHHNNRGQYELCLDVLPPHLLAYSVCASAELH